MQVHGKGLQGRGEKVHVERNRDGQVGGEGQGGG